MNMNNLLKTKTCLIALTSLCCMIFTTANAADQTTAPPAEDPMVCRDTGDASSRASAEVDILLKRIADLESRKSLDADKLRQKKLLRIRELAADVKLQRAAISDFEVFIPWMSSTIAGFSRYIQGDSPISVVARVLMIPTAGQASTLTKFISSFTALLNDASLSITRYQNSSRQFISMVENIDSTRLPDEKRISDVSVFAGQKLLTDMNAVRQKLATVSELAAGTLAVLESFDQYSRSTDENLKKIKGLFKKGVDPQAKRFLTENSASLKEKAGRFNAKLKYFEDQGVKEETGINALAVYDELLAEVK